MRQHQTLLKVAVASSVIGFVSMTLVLLWQRQHQQSTDQQEDEDDKKSTERENLLTSELIPGHLKRAMYKEKRRKESVRFLAMKKPMYDNIEMYDPDGLLLCTISQKKANWYVKKNLGEWNKQKTAIQLLFKPKGKSENAYNQAQKKNICVSCGEDKHFMRHYVVPYSYRCLLPEKYKSHMPHDIVIMCPDCHMTCEQATQRRQKELENKLRKDKATAQKLIPSKELYHVRSCALALLNHKDHLPEKKILEYEDLVRKQNKLSGQEEITPTMLQGTIDMETHIPNPKFIPGAQLVVDDLKNEDDKIASFIRVWRLHFLETVQPRYLPTAWSVESPVHCDNPSTRVAG